MKIVKMYYGDLTEWMDYNAAECDDYIPGCLIDNMVITAKDGTRIFAYERAATEWNSYYECHVYSQDEQNSEEYNEELKRWTQLEDEIYKEIEAV